MLTQTGTNITLVHPSPSVISFTEDGDATGQATTYLVTAPRDADTPDSTGAATGTEATAAADTGNATPPPLTSRADNPDLINAGFPALWRVDSSDHSSVKIQETLDGYAKAAATAHHDVVLEWPITLWVDDVVHPLGTYRVGDTVQLIVKGDPWVPAGRYTQRIVDVSVSDGKVALKVSVAL